MKAAAVRAAALALLDAMEPLIPAFVGTCLFALFLLALGAPFWAWFGLATLLFWTVTRERA